MPASIFFIAFVFSTLTYVAGKNDDLSALMDLKISLDPEGSSLSSWKEDADPCGGKFEGIACDGCGRVANISLQGKGLSGHISPSIGRLLSLSGLFLHYNQLTGAIPLEIAALGNLSDLYLNVNRLSGEIPAAIGDLPALQVLELGYNGLSGSIPSRIGGLKRLTVVSLQSNRLSGAIPASLGDLPELTRLDLSCNQFFGSIPSKLALLPRLRSLDLRNNTLSGRIPAGLKKLRGGFHYRNNKGLCGEGFSSLDRCERELPEEIPQSAAIISDGLNSATSSSNLKIILPAVGSAILAAVLTSFWCYRRRKQKIGSTVEVSDGRETEVDLGKIPPSTAVDGVSHVSSDDSARFNLEEIELATQHFSDPNILGSSGFGSTYKGVLRDGSRVAVKRIRRTSCRGEEAEFFDGLKLLASLSHDNILPLKGVCSSAGRGECFLVYDFAANGCLSQYLETKGKPSCPRVLTWTERVAIIKGIAAGLEYLHSGRGREAALIHQNLSTDKILLGDGFKPMIGGAGMQRLLADDVVFSGQKVSAAMGYLAPEYAISGRFSEKSDVYAFGVILLQILAGKRKVNPLRPLVDPGKLEDLLDPRLESKFSPAEAGKLLALALACTSEAPSLRPAMAAVVLDLAKLDG